VCNLKKQNLQKMKNVLTTLLILLSVAGFSQTKISEPNQNTIKNDYLKGLHKPTEEERENISLQLTPNLDIYTSEGKKITFNEVLPLLKSKKFSLDPYINDNNELKAAVLSPVIEDANSIEQKVSKKTEKGERVGKYAKPFNVTDINGEEYSLEELKGKIIVLNFWFVECKPCVMEIPDLNKLVEKYEGEEVVFLGLAINKTQKLNSFLTKKEFKYKIIPESMDVINSYEITSYPAHIVINQSSKVVFSATGLGSNTIGDLEKTIKKLLKE